MCICVHMCVWYVSVWRYVLCGCGMRVYTWQIIHVEVRGHPWVPVLLFCVDWKGAQKLQHYLIPKLKETLLPLHPILPQEFWDCRFALLKSTFTRVVGFQTQALMLLPWVLYLPTRLPSSDLTFVIPHLVEPRESKNCTDVHRHFYTFYIIWLILILIAVIMLFW